MITLTKVISTEVVNFFRNVKILRFGKDDVRTADQLSSFGIDSNPVKGMIALYAETGTKGDKVIVGYLNQNQIAAIGETRIFSTDSDGALKTYLWLRNDGTIQVGGDSKNMVRFQELEAGFNQLKEDHNKLVQAFNNHMHATAGSGAPSTPTPIPDSIPASESNADITGAKIDEIKTL